MAIRFRFLLGRRHPRNNTPVEPALPLDPKVIDDMWLKAQARGLIDEKGAAAVAAAAAAQREEEFSQFLGELEAESAEPSAVREHQPDTDEKTWRGDKVVSIRVNADKRSQTYARRIHAAGMVTALALAGGLPLLPVHSALQIVLMVLTASLFVIVLASRVKFVRAATRWLLAASLWKEQRETGVTLIGFLTHVELRHGQLNIVIGDQKRKKRGDRSERKHEEDTDNHRGRGTAARR